MLKFKTLQLLAPIIHFAQRAVIESHWKEFGNSIHPSVWHPDIYPDYYDSWEEWEEECGRKNSV
jgi:hypothetical protein